ncbi:nucleotidyltransferase, putative [Plasmodium ovale]|uniref:Nucleotidyltransferase, putative n=1 Tax=Plasmodium ovale TaxID=36330 RepID=A0A1D3TKG3_PLAOA|nr:nucleotidyltransferase, putative [Plasmodium ovale]
MDDSYYFLYNEEESEQVKEAKQELHRALKRNRQRSGKVNKPMREASNVISLVEDKRSKLRKGEENTENGENSSGPSLFRNSRDKDNGTSLGREGYWDNNTHGNSTGMHHYKGIPPPPPPSTPHPPPPKGSDSRTKINSSLKEDGGGEEEEHIAGKKGHKGDSITPTEALKSSSTKRKRSNENEKGTKKKLKSLTRSVNRKSNSVIRNTDSSVKSKENLSDISSCSWSTSSNDTTSTNYLHNDKMGDNKFVGVKTKTLFYGDGNSGGNSGGNRGGNSGGNIGGNSGGGHYGMSTEGEQGEIPNGKKIMRTFKIHFKKLTKDEKKYYKYIIRKLNIRYDSKKNVFYTDGIFTETFAKIVKKERNNFNCLGYLEYACFYILEWLTPTKEEKLLKYKCLLKLELIVKSIFPNCKMEVFGSFVTGLSIPGSDVDVCFMNIDEDEINCLYIIAYALIKMNIHTNIKIIKDAKVKILKYTDKESGVQVDICINQKSSKETTNFIKEQIKHYIYLRPLVLLLKFFLNSRNLNETYTGGIGSFLLCCMVLHFLQLHPSTFDMSTYNNTYLTKLLIQFFYFYSIDYNIGYNCSVIRGLGHCMPRRLRKEFERTNRLCIENPIDTSIDVGMNAYKIRYILYVFSHNFCNLVTLLRKLQKDNCLFTRRWYSSNKNNIEGRIDNHTGYAIGSKIDPDSIFPLFFANFVNPDNIVFTKRMKVDFPSPHWSIQHFDYAFSEMEKQSLFEMLCDDVSAFLGVRSSIDESDSINLFASVDKIFSFSLDIYNNIFKYA